MLYARRMFATRSTVLVKEDLLIIMREWREVPLIEQALSHTHQHLILDHVHLAFCTSDPWYDRQRP